MRVSSTRLVTRSREWSHVWAMIYKPRVKPEIKILLTSRMVIMSSLLSLRSLKVQTAVDLSQRNTHLPMNKVTHTDFSKVSSIYLDLKDIMLLLTHISPFIQTNYASDAQAPTLLPGTRPDEKSVHCLVVPYEQHPPSGRHSKFHELQSLGSET